MGFRIRRVFRRSRHYPIDIVRFMWGVVRRKPDWVLLQGPLKVPLLDALLVRFLRLFGVKAAITVHDVLPHYPRAWSAAEYGFYYRSFDKAIAHSQAASAALKTMGISADILIVPHGSYDLFNLTGIGQGAARQKIAGIKQQDFVVLFFGALEPRKGFMEFLAMAQAASGKVNLKFLIAGGNSLAAHGSELVSRFDAVRCLPNLVIHDHRIDFEDVENHFSACDVVALPYLEGTTSGVLKLALAFGKPVIATTVGDLPEQLPVGAGILVAADGAIPENFLKAIETIRGNYPGYASAMQSGQKNADWGEIARQVILHLSH
jgi:glycosyltransferase involved in cell wall biosynthesis